MIDINFLCEKHESDDLFSSSKTPRWAQTTTMMSPNMLGYVTLSNKLTVLTLNMSSTTVTRATLSATSASGTTA